MDFCGCDLKARARVENYANTITTHCATVIIAVRQQLTSTNTKMLQNTHLQNSKFVIFFRRWIQWRITTKTYFCLDFWMYGAWSVNDCLELMLVLIVVFHQHYQVLMLLTTCAVVVAGIFNNVCADCCVLSAQPVGDILCCVMCTKAF